MNQTILDFVPGKKYPHSYLMYRGRIYFFVSSNMLSGLQKTNEIALEIQ